MECIHKKLQKKMRKKYGIEEFRKMEKYILEKFCLKNGELILYECEGSLFKKVPRSYKLSVRRGSIFITNRRIIAEGKLTASLTLIPEIRERTPSDWIPIYGELKDLAKPSRKDDVRARERLIALSSEEGCYGYMFPINDTIYIIRFGIVGIVCQCLLHAVQCPIVFHAPIVDFCGTHQGRTVQGIFFETGKKLTQGPPIIPLPGPLGATGVESKYGCPIECRIRYYWTIENSCFFI